MAVRTITHSKEILSVILGGGAGSAAQNNG